MSHGLSVSAAGLTTESTVPCDDASSTAGLHPAVGNASRIVEQSIKRGIDVLAASLAIVCLSPLLLLIAAMIRLDSRGAILFRQKRTGRGGRVFWCLKFRTMVVDAEARLKELEYLNEVKGGVLFKIKKDPRITRIGGFLRRSSLDELPQLFNILAGHMSLVGPRPLQLRDCELLEQLDPAGYRLRLSRPQGLTGLWQVSGRSDTSSHGMLKIDLEYVADWSLSRDLKIIVKTVVVVLTGRGAC